MLASRGYVPQDVDAAIEIFLGAIRDSASEDYNKEQIRA
jgi:hypothetical protein